MGMYRAFIRVQGYNKKEGIIHEIGSFLFGTSDYAKCGSPVWVEVQGGEGWDDIQLGYESWSAAFAAIQDAKGLCKPRPE